MVLRFVMLSCLCLLMSCQQHRYRIGVSQCSNDGWRQKANREIKIGQYQYSNVDVVFASAENDGQRQVAQIDSMVADGVDLLVVSPSDTKTVAPAIERAYEKGIPIVLYDRMSQSEKYTAFIGADNVAIGRFMAQYVISQVNDGDEVVEITGLSGSTPVEERHCGFIETIAKSNKHIKVTTLQGDWTIKTPRRLMIQLLKEGHRPACVFCHNDGEALGEFRGNGGDIVPHSFLESACRRQKLDFRGSGSNVLDRRRRTGSLDLEISRQRHGVVALEGNFGNVRPREGEADTARNIVEREVHRGRICHKGVSLRVVSILHRLLRSGKVVVDYSARNLGTGLIRRKCQDRVAIAHILQAGCAFEISRRSGGCIQGFEFVSGSAEENGPADRKARRYPVAQ